MHRIREAFFKFWQRSTLYKKVIKIGNGTDWFGVAVALFCWFVIIAIILIFLGVIFVCPGLYILGPNQVAIEISALTGEVSSPITHIENGGMENLHWANFFVYHVLLYDAKIRTIKIEHFGEQRKGSANIIANEGLDYEQWPNHAVIGYRLVPENLDKFFTTLSGKKMRVTTLSKLAITGDRRSTLEEMIKGLVFSLLSEGKLDQDELQSALDKKLGANIAEITSVDCTKKITK